MYRNGCFFIILFRVISLFAQTDSLQISWNPNPEPDIQEYRLYRSVNSLNNFQILQIITHPRTHTVDRNSIQPGNLYAFTLTAVDTGGLQSEFSDTVAVGIPDVNWTLTQIVNGQSTTVPLNSFLSDPDDPLSNLTLNFNNLNHLSASRVNNNLILTPEPLTYVGTASFSLQVEDTAGFWDHQNIQLQVTAPANHPPSISSTPITIAWVDSLYRYQVIASDPDPGETLSFSLISSPAFLTVNSSSGLISGIPQPADTGVHSVTVRVTDLAGAYATQNYNLHVQHQNQPPLITSIPDQNILEGESFASISLDNYVSDPDDPDSLIHWSFSGNVALLLAINEQRIATINVPNPEWNGTETIIWQAIDPSGLFDNDTSTFTVLAVNDPPRITSQPVTGATRDSLYRYQVQAFDPDPGDSLSFSLTVAPQFLQIHSRTGLISGIPALADTGRHNVTVRVQDLAGSSDTQSYILTVMYQNNPPVITRIPDQTVAEGGIFTSIVLDEFVSDPESGDEDLSWSYRGNQDLLVVIDGQRLATIQIPDSEWFGVEHIIFTVSDPGGLFDEDTVRFQVLPVNDPPILELSELRIDDNGNHVVDLKPFAQDVDNSALELNWEFLDFFHFQFSWEDFSNKLVRIERTGNINFEIGRFVVSDPEGLADTAEVRIIYRIEGENSPPHLVFLPSQLRMEEDSTLMIQLFEIVVDSTNLFSELSWQFYPDPELGYSYQSATGILQIYAQPDWYGNSNFRWRVTDPEGLYDEKTVLVVVKPRVDLTTIEIRAIAPGEVEIAVAADLPNEVSFTFWVTPSLQTTYKSLDYAMNHQFILRNLMPDTTYRYSLTLTDTSGFSHTYEQASFRTHLNPTQIGQEEEILVYPNPFRPARGHSVVVFDNLPMEMTELLVFTPAGETVFEKEIEGVPQRRMPWNVINHNGEQLASGFYIYVVKGENGKRIKSGKLAVIR